jgi:hypothetical protein
MAKTISAKVAIRRSTALLKEATDRLLDPLWSSDTETNYKLISMAHHLLTSCSKGGANGQARRG